MLAKRAMMSKVGLDSITVTVGSSLNVRVSSGLVDFLALMSSFVTEVFVKLSI